MLQRAAVLIFFTTSLFAQPVYFGARVPLTNTRYASASTAQIISAEQSIAATAATPNAALIVWNESGTAHAGIRARGGAWRESVLATGERAIAAASDGISFIVVSAAEDGWTASILDERGVVLQRTARVAFEARAVASTARGHAVIGVLGSDVVAARVGSDGSVSAPMVVRSGSEDPAVAADGTNYLAVFQTPDQRVEAVRLDDALQRLDPADILVWEDAAEDPAVAFDGERYVVVFRNGTYVKGRRVTRDGVAVREAIQTGGGTAPRRLSLTRLGDWMGLAWFDGEARFLLLDEWDVKTTKSYPSRRDAAAQFVALPEQIAIVQSDVLDEAPHFGSERVLMAVMSDVPSVAVPDAPRVEVTSTGGMLRVDWSRVQQPVTGYRIEYRIDETPWVEAEGWTDAATRTALLTPQRPGTYGIRVRAWSDAGTGAYSEPVTVTVTPGRRRAVR